MTRSAKPLEQDLGVGRVIAQIGNDERPAVVQAINRCQCFRARAGVEPLRQFIEVLEIDELRRKRAASADNRRRAVFRAADIVRDDGRLAEIPGVGMYGRLRCAFIELPFKRTDLASLPECREIHVCRPLHRARVVPSQDMPRRYRVGSTSTVTWKRSQEGSSLSHAVQNGSVRLQAVDSMTNRASGRCARIGRRAAINSGGSGAPLRRPRSMHQR